MKTPTFDSWDEPTHWQLVYLSFDGYVWLAHRKFRRATDWEIEVHKAIEAKAQEPQADADGWIEWKGGECPVSDETLVDVRFREPLKGEPDSIVSLATEAGEWEWDHNHGTGDITHYRLVPSQPAPIITDWVEVVTR